MRLCVDYFGAMFFSRSQSSVAENNLVQFAFWLIWNLLKSAQKEKMIGKLCHQVKVYMTDVFISSIKFPQCTDKYNNKNSSIASFLPRVLMYQKSEISLPVEYKTARPKTGDWEWLWRHFRTSSFAKKKSGFLRHFLIFSYKQRTFVPFLSGIY